MEVSSIEFADFGCARSGTNSMELVTHALCGIGLSQCRAAWASRRDAVGVLVATSVLPDIDIVFALIDPTSAALQRRLWTHSLVILPLIGGVSALVLSRVFRHLRVSVVLLLTALGLSAHLLLDVMNGYGVGLLFPFSNQRFELPLLFIADPVIIAALALSLLCGWLFRFRADVRTWVARCAFAAIAIHIAFSLYLRQIALGELDSLRAGPDKRAFTYLAPEPFAPFRWKGIYANGDVFEQATIYPLSGRIEPLLPVESCASHPLVARARRDRVGREVEGLLKAPVWSVRGQRASVYDLRFRFSFFGNKWDPFIFSFDVDGERVTLVETTISERAAQAADMVRDVIAGAGGTGRSTQHPNAAPGFGSAPVYPLYMQRDAEAAPAGPKAENQPTGSATDEASATVCPRPLSGARARLRAT